MSTNQSSISNLSKDKYTIKAESTTTISFMGASPNYYRITNGGATPLYLGVSMMPTEDFFDMKIPSGTTKLFVDAYGHDEVYIFNPSVTDANIIITSFNAPFDSSVLALSDIGQDFSQIDFSGEVDATGDLKTNIKKIVDAVENNQGNSEDNTNLEAILKQLTEVWVNGTSTIRTMLNDTYDRTNKIQKVLDNNNDLNTYGNLVKQLGELSKWLNVVNPIYKDIMETYEDNKSLGDIIYSMYEVLSILADSLQNSETISGEPSIYGMLEKLIDNKPKPTRYVNVEEPDSDFMASLTVDDYEYIGEMINYHKESAAIVQCKLHDNSSLYDIKIKTWNEICHTLKAKEITLFTDDYISPTFVIYNK